MSFFNYYKSFHKLLATQYPSTSQFLPSSFNLEYLVSPHKIRLPRTIARQAESAIRAHYSLAQKASYQNLLGERPSILNTSHPLSHPNEALLMAYDFHTTQDGKTFLIEINTNASTFLLSELVYQTHGQKSGWADSSALTHLWQSFIDQAHGKPISNLAVVDEHVKQQKMLIEFFMYKDWLSAHGWKSQILDVSDLKILHHQLCDANGSPFDFIYNRTTDFYWDQPQSQVLKMAYQQNLACITPHPQAYWLYADKSRLVQMSQPLWLESAGATPEECQDLRHVLIPTYEKSQFGTAAEIWSQRKKLFFKPRQSYGGKSVYRGESVSRKVFERLMQEDILVQNYIPAQNWIVGESDEYLAHWKFDLRFFVYRDQIQLAIARSYQGQVTNFSSQYGGLTAVEFV